MTKNLKSGFSCKFVVRETPDKGLGVFAMEPLKQGQIVWRYTSGLFKVHDEQSFLAFIEEMAHEQIVYELTHVLGLEDFPNCVIRGFDQGFLINHASDANLATNFSTRLRAKLDVSSPSYLEDVANALLEDRFAIVTTRDILPGEEFTMNYSSEVFDPPFYLRLYEEYGVEEDYLEDS